VVRSSAILGLGLPSSANGNCEWPLPVLCWYKLYQILTDNANIWTAEDGT